MVEAKSELERYLESTPESCARWTEARQYLPGGDSRNSIFWKPYPIFITDASGSRVMDADNVQRIDFINTMTTMILGHGPETVMDAVRRQLNRGIGYNAPNERQVDLARILCERIPSFDLVRFTNSGTEATLNTLRAARAFTGRTRFAKVEGGYHGTHDGVTVSVRVDPATAGDADSPVPVLGSAGLTPGVSEQVVVIPFNDAESSRRILEENAEDLAAIIIEPVMGSVGMVPARREYLAFLRDFATANGTVLIFDEVISYRVAPGGSQEYYGITPDMTALGKIIGGGLPVGAFGGRKDIMDLYDPTSRSGRFPRGHIQCQSPDHAGRDGNPGTVDARCISKPGGEYGGTEAGNQGCLRGVGNAGAGYRAGLTFWHPLYRQDHSELPGHCQRRLRPEGPNVPGLTQRGNPDGFKPGWVNINRHQQARH